MSEPISTDKLEAMLAGCEGAQGGPWKLDKFACYVWAPAEKGGDFPIMDDLTKAVGVSVGMLRGWGYYTGKGHGALGLPPDEAVNRMRATGEHIARLDPATVSSMARELLASRSTIEDLRRERDEARQIVRDIYWMALRYADGRKSYAVGMCNDAVQKGYDGGWLERHTVDYLARDGMSAEWVSITARLEAAERELALVKEGGKP